MTEYIKVVCNKLQSICKTKADNIPVLPSTVTFDSVSDYIGKIDSVPIGIEKESLITATFNLARKYGYAITGEDIDSFTLFVQGIAKLTNKIENSKTIVMDALETLNKDSLKDIIYDTGSCTQTAQAVYDIYAKEKLDMDADPTSIQKVPYTICVINGLSSLLSRLDDDTKMRFTEALENAKALEKIKFIVVDTIDNIKSLTYEDWFKNLCDLGEGVWMGNGISNQFTMKVTTNSRELRDEIDVPFGYVIEKGKATQVKLIIDE